MVNNPGTLPPEPPNHPAAAAAMIGMKDSFPQSWGSRKLCACKMEFGRNASTGALVTVSDWQVLSSGEGGEV